MADLPSPRPGLIIAGRQHSGNSVLCNIFGNAPHCVVNCGESNWFERVANIDDTATVQRRARTTCEILPGLGGDGVALRPKLERWLEDHPEADAYEAVRHTLTLKTAHAGADLWVLKATSFVFYAETVLRRLEGTKMIYLIRNPLDIAASAYRRVSRTLEAGQFLLYGDWLFTTVYGWMRGLRIAEALKEGFPDRVRLVRYENLVSDETVLPALFDFADVDYDSAFANVSHINRSDRISDDNGHGNSKKGLNESRVGYYTSVLDAGEILAVRQLLRDDLLQAVYPDLTVPVNTDGSTRLSALRVQVQCGLRLLRRWGWEIARNPKHASGRLLRRLRLMLS
jgi:hypothetical protein